MFIRNIEDTNKEHFECNGVIGNYLIKREIPLLARRGNTFIFSKTGELKETINAMPWYLKLLMKGGGNNE